MPAARTEEHGSRPLHSSASLTWESASHASSASPVVGDGCRSPEEVVQMLQPNRPLPPGSNPKRTPLGSDIPIRFLPGCGGCYLLADRDVSAEGGQEYTAPCAGPSVAEMYLLRLDETGTPSYVGRGDSLSRPYTLSRESIGVGTSISSILNSYAEIFG